MGRIYQRSAEDLQYAIDRCFFDADCGLAFWAIERIKDLLEEFPGNAHVLYAQGLLRRDYLGQGLAAHQFFVRSYEASTLPTQQETRWFSLCNMIPLSPSEAEFRRWAQVALRDYGQDKDECRMWAAVIERMDSGEAYHVIIGAEVFRVAQKGQHGLAAALLEIALQDPSLDGHDAFEVRKQRAMSLRALDAAAEKVRQPEQTPPAERVMLNEAMLELGRAIEMDEYDATLWNYRSAWSALLLRDEEAIQYADRAIELRPEGYDRPFHNKAVALWRLGRLAEAQETARQAVARRGLEGIRRRTWRRPSRCCGLCPRRLGRSRK